MQVPVFINNMGINPKSLRQRNTVFPNAKKLRKSASNCMILEHLHRFSMKYQEPSHGSGTDAMA